MESVSLITTASQPQCPLILEDWQDDLALSSNRQPYQASSTVDWFHNSWYRFGRSNDVVPFILEERGADSEYLTGLFATILITGVCLIFWMSLIVIISYQLRHKLPNKKKQADIYRSIPQGEILLAYEQDEHENQYFGRPFRKPLPPRKPDKPIMTDNDSLMALTSEERKEYEKRIQDYNRDLRRYQTDMLGWKKQYTNYKRKVRCARTTIILSCLIVIISSTLFYINGAKQLIHATKETKHTLAQLKGDTQLEMDRIQGLLDYSQLSNITEILDYTNTYCPLKRPRICTSSMMMQDCNWTGIPYKTSIQSWTSTLIHYQTNLTLELYDFQQDLVAGKDEMDSWITRLNHLQNGLQTSSILVFLLDALCVYILIGVALAVSKQRHIPKFFVWIRSYALIPLFVIVIVCGWIFASSFTLASLTTSDFCASSMIANNNVTETTAILALLQQANLSPSLEELIRQYVTGCSNAASQDVFGQDITRLVQSVRDAKLLESSLIIFANDGSMKNSCGPFSESILSGAAHMTQQELCTVADLLHDTRLHLKCSAWDPIYTQMTHQLLCTDAMDAFAWITISQLVIVFVSMLILTFRIAILPVQYVRFQPFRAKALSKQVTADLKKMSALAQKATEEKLNETKIEPVYKLGYYSSSRSSSGTAESVSDIFTAEVSTAEPSYSDSHTSSLQTNHTGNMGTKIAPKMIDEEEEDAEQPSTILASHQQTSAPIMAQSIEEGMDEDEHDEDTFDVKKPESTSMRSESARSDSIPPASERSIINSVTASSIALTSQEDSEEKRPESYSNNSEGVPASLRSMTSAAASEVSSIKEIPETPKSAIRMLMENGAAIRHKAISDDSSFEEVTIRSDSEFEEATYYSVSSHQKKSSGNLSVAEVSDTDGSKSHQSGRKSGQSAHSRLSGHSQGSARFLSSLEDVAEESPNDPNPSKKSKASPFAPGNAFMDHLLVDDEAGKDSTEPPKHLSLPVDFSGRPSFAMDTASSLGGEDNMSKSMNVDTTSDTIEASARYEEANFIDDDSGGAGAIINSPKNPGRRGGMHKSKSVKNIEAVKAAEQGMGDGDESFHFSLNCDMETFHSTDFGDFSSSEGGNGDEVVVEYEIIEEIILPERLSARNLTGRSTSVSALSMSDADDVYKSFASATEVMSSSGHGRMSAMSAGEPGKDDPRAQFQDMLHSNASEMETGGNKTDGTAAAQKKDGVDHAPPKQIDINALQKRVESIRSLGSASAGMGRGGMKDHRLSGMTIESFRSSMASTPSIAISAATMDEKKFRLDDDMVGSESSFGLAMGGIDSEMLAVVDEDLENDEQPSSSQTPQAQMRNLARTLRPQQHGWRIDNNGPRSAGLGGRPTSQIFLQRGGDTSMRSVNSALSDDLNFRGSMHSASRLPSMRSLASSRASSTPSIAISAATMNENQFYLEDDHMDSAGSFGHHMLPSRAIDSEMLQIVDETWTEDLQDQEIPSSKPAKTAAHLPTTHPAKPHNRLPANHIFFQKGVDSVRSLGMDSFSGMSHDEYDSSYDKPMKPTSGLSLGTSPSIAISATTMDEKQFRLDHDSHGSSDSFGHAMLPSRGMDSAMLEVVDEAMAEDGQDTPSNREKRKVEGEDVLGNLQPPDSVHTKGGKSPKMDSDPSLGEPLEKSGEMSLVDPFEKSIEIGAAR